MDERARRRRLMWCYLAGVLVTAATTALCQAALLVLRVQGAH